MRAAEGDWDFFWSRPDYGCPAEALRWRLSAARGQGKDWWAAWPAATEAVLKSITDKRTRGEWRAVWRDPAVLDAFWLAYELEDDCRAGSTSMLTTEPEEHASSREERQLSHA